MYFLLFTLHFDRDRGLDQGRLSLNHLDNGTLDIWIATSSISTKQDRESFRERGGLLPPQYRVPNLKKWEVDLNSIPMPQVKGVEGNFYRLLPFKVVTDRGGVRSDFGIHKDANSPGSMGCIVMGGRRFAEFEAKMQGLKIAGVNRLPLFVQYS